MNYEDWNWALKVACILFGMVAASELLMLLIMLIYINWFM